MLGFLVCCFLGPLKCQKRSWNDSCVELQVSLVKQDQAEDGVYVSDDLGRDVLQLQATQTGVVKQVVHSQVVPEILVLFLSGFKLSILEGLVLSTIRTEI